MDVGIGIHIQYRLLHLNLKDISREDALQLKHDIFHKKLKGTLVCIPTVYFIGFPRSGSSQIYQMMLHNPALVGGITKEPHWWTRHYQSVTDSNTTERTLEVLRYLVQYFPAVEYVKRHPQALAVDASQSTIWDTRIDEHLCTTPTLITSVVPGAKFIVVMRDPVERLYSDFAYICEEHWRLNEMETVPQSYLEDAVETFHDVVKREIAYFEECLQTAPLEECTSQALSGKHVTSHCGRVRLGISLYYVHIARWLAVVPRDKFLFLSTDDLHSDPYALIQSVWAFLGVPFQTKQDLIDILYTKLNTNKLAHMKIMDKTKQMLRTFFRPYNTRLSELLGDKRFLWND